MSELDVHRIICPWEHRELLELRDRVTLAEQKMLALRRMLRATDPSLPDEYDGNAWALIEDR